MPHPSLPPRPLRTILAGTDLSDDALVAVQAAALLARASGAGLHVLHAGSDDDGGPGGLAEARMAHHVRHVIAPEDPVTLHLAAPPAFRALTEAVDRLSADLVVVGSHRPRRAFDGLLGATGDRVLRTSLVPVLVVNRSLSRPPRRMVVATDLSPTADRALALAVDWVLAWQETEDGEGTAPLVELVHVAAFAHPSYRPSSPTAALLERSEAARTRSGNRVRIRPRVLSAPLAPEGLLRAAEEMHADLVVMGTHGHGGLIRTLLGSVASEVARTLPFPVLLVPPE